jgi:hypothetical protein
MVNGTSSSSSSDLLLMDGYLFFTDGYVVQNAAFYY